MIEGYQLLLNYIKHITVIIRSKTSSLQQDSLLTRLTWMTYLVFKPGPGCLTCNKNLHILK